ncbi:site-specific DNA-methyltransferase [Nocardioides sp. KIGAM211]|uniref:Site-specific DNA-methyltransferase n=1 Tax=Nocardioides luti TaxID=2761101 RepID=A0A7X0VC66_9ACTN|nr:site-specific DNA-methyltransferase [Nocardioides luti]MBB6627928.1 site-specific DNA-methyltransferase [Nocardioides luti]
MSRLNLTSFDALSDNLGYLVERFPHAVTEVRSADGTATRAVDWDVLRQEFSGQLVEGPQERYRLDWPGKREALLLSNSPTARSLRPIRTESVDFDTTRNLFIEGDNLDTLKLLQEPLLGQVKMIYIDPPYNTGNDFLYADDFADSRDDYLKQSGQVDEAGARLVATSETGGRFHSAWLSMMYARLKVARSLLTEDGVGFVSIDGNEVAQLKMLLSELYGPNNFVATITWVSNLKGRQISDGGPAGTHEYILCFAKDAQAVNQFRGSGATFRKLMPDVYKGAAYALKEDAKGPYVTKNELYNTNSKFNERTAPTMVFRIHYNPDSGEVRVSDLHDETTYPGFITAMPHPNSRPGLNWHAWRWSRAKILADHEDLEFDTTNGKLRIRTKIRDVDGMTMKDIVIGPSTMTGQADLEALGMGRLFDTPKPVGLLETLVSVATGPDDLVLDFFAGSCATAEAVLQQNVTDGGQRRFIMIQLDEPCGAGTPAAAEGFSTIAAIGRERVRRAGSALRANGFTGDIGFRALRLDSSTRADVRRTPDEVSQESLLELQATVKPDRTDEDLLFDALLDLGIDPASPVVELNVDGTVIFDVADGAVIACFARKVSQEMLRSIAGPQPLHALFRDAAFETDAARINAEQLLKQLSPNTTIATV